MRVSLMWTDWDFNKFEVIFLARYIYLLKLLSGILLCKNLQGHKNKPEKYISVDVFI